ncbi:hypothetical protein [Actinomadura litoris]|uniref:DUF4115 domain-containing protein n=1 Tax=Actinomadura litoris TaxID=2678616 RepID=A0A7K1KUZ0_9ACTN|nr:hypothetical protein [Actinomadura litoris]MUN35855.1 hypothetical protein [Actinomadura litoris]
MGLLVAGGLSLVNAVSGDSDNHDPATVSPSPGDGGGQNRSAPSRSPSSSASGALPLVIRVTGPATNVVVRVATTGEILTQALLSTGDTRKYEQTPLQVVATNGGALEVMIYGRKWPPKPSGSRGQWFVSAKK